MFPLWRSREVELNNKAVSRPRVIIFFYESNSYIIVVISDSRLFKSVLQAALGDAAASRNLCQGVNWCRRLCCHNSFRCPWRRSFRAWRRPHNEETPRSPSAECTLRSGVLESTEGQTWRAGSAARHGRVMWNCGETCEPQHIAGVVAVTAAESALIKKHHRRGRVVRF